MNRDLYGLMIKYPEPGRVKTRLAKDIGNEKAAEIYRQVAEQVMKQTDPISFSHYAIQCPPLKKGGIAESCSRDELIPGAYERVIFYDPPERLCDFEQWLRHEKFIPQQGNDVGERMDNAIRELLALGAGKAVITGADIPGLDSDIIARAFTELEHADIVIGPAKDGGYYLIGMKEPHAEIFQGIPWSTEKVLRHTVSLIETLHLTVAKTPVLSDLDRIEDLAGFPQW
ncbi:MAG: TIGR04282 family arsenosugar biosynthesis glycosyltransferase [Nitrospirae bacterium]|nr:TIGR04282 family arsenosugar biosynthesis glycosyltransferase [Nitrospirota bacterium]